MEINILHLSDLHFDKQEQANIWSNQLATDLKYELNISNLDGLILSGDIGNKSTQEEYEAAKSFIYELRQDFPLSPEQIIIVPGNHDLNWENSDEAYEAIKRKKYNGPIITVDGKKRADPDYAIDKGGDYIEQKNINKYKERFIYLVLPD